MHLVGIDFGGHSFRSALNRDGVPALIGHNYSTDRTFFTVELVKKQAIKISPQCRIIPLKRILDFDKVVKVTQAERNSLDLFAELLTEVRIEAEKLMADHAISCVLSLPPCFSQRQRAAYNESADRAGFRRVRLLDDTIAALIACWDDVRGCEKVLVYAWGASTFSVVLYRLKGNSFQPITQEGNRSLGGIDLDTEIANIILASLANKLGDELPYRDHQFLDRVAIEAEKAKLVLSAGMTATVQTNALLQGKALSLLPENSIIIPRTIFDSTLNSMISETLELVEMVLETEACSNPDAVVTVGGMTLLSDVKKMLRDRFQVAITHAGTDAVAIGSLLYGNQIMDAELKLPESSHPSIEKGPKAAGTNTQVQQDVTLKPTNLPSVPVKHKLISRWADNFVPFLDSAQHQYQENRLDKAISEVEKLFAELGKFSSDLYQRAAAALGDEGYQDQSIRYLKMALLRSPKNESVTRDLAMVCYRSGVHARSQKKTKESISILQLGIDAIRSLEDGKKNYVSLLARLHHLKG